MRMAIAFLALWLGLILQATVFEIPPFNGLHPNFVLVLIVLIALTRGSKTALLMGIAIGLIQDVNYGTLIGLHAFTYGVVGYFAGAAFQQFLHRSLAITFFVTVVFTFVDVWIAYGMARLFGITAIIGTQPLIQSLTQVIINGVLLLLLYPIFVKWIIEPEKGRYRETRPE